MVRVCMQGVLTCLVLLLAGCGGLDGDEAQGLQPNSLGELLTCTQVEQDQCVSNESAFPADTPEIFATVILNNATVGARATCTLVYLGETPEELASFDITVQQVTQSLRSYLVFYFTNDEPWDPGNYRVSVETDTAGSPPVSREFSIQ